MKKIYLFILFFLPAYFSFAQSDFIVQYRDGKNYIIYKVSKVDTWKTLADDFYLNVNDLAYFNNVLNVKSPITRSSVDIPLTESNFYKKTEIPLQNDLQAIYFPIHRSETVEDISRLYFIPKSSLLLWNKPETFTNGEKVIIGFLKYKKQGDIPTTFSSKESNTTTNTQYNTTQSNNQNKAQQAAGYSEPETPNTYKNPYERTKPIPPTDDPNRSKTKTYRKPFKETWDNWVGKLGLKKKDVKTSHNNSPKAIPPADVSGTDSTYKSYTKTTKDKSIRGLWDEVVNGKETNANKNTYGNKGITPNNDKLQSNKKTKIEDWFNSLTSTFKNEKPKNKKPNPSTSTATSKNNPSKNTSLKDVWDRIVNGKPSNKNEKLKIENNTKNAEPVVTKNSSTTTKEKTPNTPKINTVSKDEPFQKDIVKQEAEKQVLENETLTLKDAPSTPEARNLVLNNHKNGKAAFFFSGPIGAKFYVVSNVAPKGSIVKVTNTSNNRHIMAEVIGALNPSDQNKGVIAKISDNAKLPLGTKSALFNIKLSY